MPKQRLRHRHIPLAARRAGVNQPVHVTSLRSPALKCYPDKAHPVRLLGVTDPTTTVAAFAEQAFLDQ